MPKFIKVTNVEDNVERVCLIECSLIQYVERNKFNTMTAVIVKDVSLVKCKETPDEILKLIAECED